MKDEFICSGCGSNDIRIVTKSKKVYHHANIISVIILLVAVALMVAGIYFIFQLIFNSPPDVQSVEELAEYFETMDTYFNSWKWAFILCISGLSLGVILLLFNLFSDHKTETQVIAICPNCGKTWVINVDVDALTENKQ